MGIGDWIFISAVCISPLPMIMLICLRLLGGCGQHGASSSPAMAPLRLTM